MSARETALTYAALAALQEPVLAEAQRFLMLPDLGTEERLYGALALTFSGHKEGARTIYRELTKELKKDDSYRYFPAESKEMQAEYTALLAVIGALLNESEAEDLYRYFTTQDKGQTLLVIEQFLFIKHAMESLPHTAGKMSYTLEGERRETTLEKGETLSLVLTEEKLEALNPQTEEGKILVIARRNELFTENQKPVDASLTLTKTYTNAEGQIMTSFKENDLIKMQLRYTLPTIEQGRTSQTFKITDTVPSGLQITTPVMNPSFVSMASIDPWMPENTCVSHPSEVSEQHASFFVLNNEDTNSYTCEKNTITYYARVVTPGTYRTESAIIHSVDDPSVYNFTEGSDTIHIGP